MPKAPRWTNASVVAFAGTSDAVEAITNRARAIAMEAMESGWSGPPYDVALLAQMRGIEVIAREDVRDARTVAGPSGEPQIEYNPTRPRGRVRYSIAHEIAHTLFDDWADRVRHRSMPEALTGDDWQLEALCNVAAAEFVMPIGSFTSLASASFSIDPLLHEQKRFDVSMEALLIRAVHLRPEDVAVFCASPIPKGANVGHYRVDYLIGSRAWQRNAVFRGLVLPEDTVISGCSAIGFTAKGVESWDNVPVRVEAVGIPPYPGSMTPRVVGVLVPTEAAAPPTPNSIEYIHADATNPSGVGPRMIVHVVTDGARTWGGGGFASAVRRAWPHVQNEFRQWIGVPKNLRLGRVHFSNEKDGVRVASVVAQHGYGPSPTPRIRYNALREGLADVARVTSEVGATVHMPRIGCGMAGGSWEVVQEIIDLTLGRAGISVTVYDLPGQRNLGQPTLFSIEAENS